MRVQSHLYKSQNYIYGWIDLLSICRKCKPVPFFCIKWVTVFPIMLHRIMKKLLNRKNIYLENYSEYQFSSKMSGETLFWVLKQLLCFYQTFSFTRSPARQRIERIKKNIVLSFCDCPFPINIISLLDQVRSIPFNSKERNDILGLWSYAKLALFCLQQARYPFY